MTDQYRRIKILSVVFMLSAIGAFFALRKSATTGTVDKEISVNIKDTSAVYKISFEYQGKEQTLQRTNGIWKINGKYEARQRWAQTILAGFNRLEVKRPVADEFKNEVFNSMKEHGVKLNVYYGDAVTKYMMMPNDNDSNSTYLLMNDGKIPYIAYVPGIVGDISEPFRLSEQEWRTRKIFSASQMGLKEIRVEYPSDPSSNVQITFGQGGFKIKDVAAIDTAKFANFLQDLQYSSLLSYINNKDSVGEAVLKNKPLAIITVADISEERSNTVEVYKNSADKKTYLGLLGKEKEPVLLRSDIFEKVMMKRDFFKRK
jgi:hypothetical protein